MDKGCDDEEIDTGRRRFLKGLAGAAVTSPLAGRATAETATDETVLDVSFSVIHQKDDDYVYAVAHPDRIEYTASDIAGRWTGNIPDHHHAIPRSLADQLDGRLGEKLSREAEVTGETTQSELEEYERILEKLDRSGETPEETDYLESISVDDRTIDGEQHYHLTTDAPSSGTYMWLHGNNLDAWARSGDGYVVLHGDNQDFTEYQDAVEQFAAAGFTVEEAFTALDYDTAAVFAVYDTVRS